MAKDLKKAAQDALDFNSSLDKVFVTSDGTAFINKNDAVNHARKLDDKTISVFERDGDDLEDDDLEGETKKDSTAKAAKPAVAKPLPAEDLTKLIGAAESEEAVNTLLANDKRATVKAAASKRIAELKQKAIDAQAAAADEALKQRTENTPVETPADKEA